MVAHHPKHESPTHELAKQLLAKRPKATPIEMHTALRLEDASACGAFVVADIQHLASFISAEVYAVIRAIKMMRRSGLIAAEFCGINDRIVVTVSSTDNEHALEGFIAELIETASSAQRGSNAA
jgi:hypothetical protein